MQERGFSSHNSYSLSKLAMMLFTAELAARKEGRGAASINCLDPGTVNTKMLYAGWGPCGMDVKVSSSAVIDQQIWYSSSFSGPNPSDLAPHPLLCPPQSVVVISGL